ncbi:unnamed protein product [Haemonchus placei]|uniref:C2 domain-containing protein n=1 Tax=Haemonchus placei TaxID=6290 RepID=A0A0N4WCU5_HAEPC|nr:unnamed protein product [Haemonchus placei]
MACLSNRQLITTESRVNGNVFSVHGAAAKAIFDLVDFSDEFNTYVTVKLQNVKSTTAVVRGNIPCWEQEFIFETNRLDEGMIIELWSKGVLWDRLLGVHFMPLTDVRYCAAPGDGRWLQMDQELETRNGQTIGTSKPTGHNVLVDARFELPFGEFLRFFFRILNFSPKLL